MPKPRDLERDKQAIELRRAGKTYREIGEALGKVTRARAHQIVARAERGAYRQIGSQAELKRITGGVSE